MSSLEPGQLASCGREEFSVPNSSARKTALSWAVVAVASCQNPTLFLVFRRRTDCINQCIPPRVNGSCCCLSAALLAVGHSALDSTCPRLWRGGGAASASAISPGRFQDRLVLFCMSLLMVLKRRNLCKTEATTGQTPKYACYARMSTEIDLMTQAMRIDGLQQHANCLFIFGREVFV